LAEHPVHVTDWIFGTASDDVTMRSAGFDPWVSLLIIVVLAMLSAVVVTVRYRRWM